MVWLATALALTLPQNSPSKKPSLPAAPARDEIVLEGGERIVGEILKQSGNYIEVRIDANTVVGFERSRITSIARGTSTGTATPKTLLAPRDDWFILRDGEGRSVGHLHGLIQVQPDGRIRLSEEWYFQGAKRSTRVTLLEVVSADLQPVSCFYHERVNDRNGRMLSESLRRGEVQGGQLVVDNRSLRGRDKQTYALQPDVRFPLAFREEIRQRPAVEVHNANQALYDPKTGQFRIVEASSVQRRKVEFESKVVHVREIAIKDGGKENSEWVDGNAQVLRREINGASLVAIKSRREHALRAEVPGAVRDSGSAIAKSQDGSLAVWIPNPVWRLDAAEQGSVSITAPLYEASATLIELDHLAANVQLASATDAVIRWLRLGIGSQLKIAQRHDVTIRKRPAVRLELRWQTLREGEARAYRGQCHVFRFQGRMLAFFSAVPRANVRAVQGDVDRILRSVQLVPQDIAPKRQGPLASRRQGR